MVSSQANSVQTLWFSLEEISMPELNKKNLRFNILNLLYFGEQIQYLDFFEILNLSALWLKNCIIVSIL